MSDLAALTAIPRTDVLPGHTISRFRIADFALLEEEFARRHIATACAAGEGLPKVVADRVLELAERDVANGHFNYGRPGFDSACLSSKALPFLLWVSLRRTEPMITRDQADALLTDDNEAKVHEAVLVATGWNISKKADAPAAGEAHQDSARQTGAASSEVSSTIAE